MRAMQRQLVLDLGLMALVLFTGTGIAPWQYARYLYKKRNRARAALALARGFRMNLLSLC
jgi:hypothetical protein